MWRGMWVVPGGVLRVCCVDGMLERTRARAHTPAREVVAMNADLMLAEAVLAGRIAVLAGRIAAVERQAMLGGVGRQGVKSKRQKRNAMARASRRANRKG